MRSVLTSLGLLAGGLSAAPAFASFTISLESSDFGITSEFNEVASFSFEIVVADSLVAGNTYDNPVLESVSYSILGLLPWPTPSGFPGFLLTRNIDGADFYDLSPDASLNFTIDADADLSDGLQFSELSGDDPVFFFNARELDQDPGRYHPPILSLGSSGTGRLENADNQSIFNNPPPPAGSGLLVDVAIGEEFIVDLTFDPSLTFAVPEPTSITLACAGLAIFSRRRGRG